MVKKNKYLILYKFNFFSLVFFIFFTGCQKKQMSISSCLTQEERKDLDYFLRFLMIGDSGAFVLFGSKPLCSSGFLKDVAERENSPYERNLLKGWDAWEKVKRHLGGRRYVVVRKEKKISVIWPGKEDLDERDFQYFVFVDIQKTAYVLAENYELFRNYVGMDFHPFEIVFDVENPDSVFWNKILHAKIDHHSQEGIKAQMIAGLLYGFGKKNVLFWCWQEELESREGKVGDYLKKAPFYPTLNENDSSTFWKYSPDFLSIPGFIALEEDETVEKYRREKEKIQRIYSGKDFLEVTLQQLAK